MNFQHVASSGPRLPEELQQTLLSQLVGALLAEELVDSDADPEVAVLEVGELEDRAGHQEAGVDLVRPLPHLLGRAALVGVGDEEEEEGIGVGVGDDVVEEDGEVCGVLEEF